MESKEKTHIKKGLIIALALILLDIVLQLTHHKFDSWVTYANSAILLIGVIISINIKDTEIEDKTAFSNIFGYGFRVSVVTVCILFIYTLLSVYVVFPGYMDEVYKQNMLQAQKLPGFNAASAEANKEMAMKVMRISLLSAVVMFNLAVGITGALIGSVVRLVIDSMNQKKG